MSSISMDDVFLGTMTVGERGQVVIPAEARKKFGIRTGEKLFVISHPSGQGVIVIKVDAVREFLNHVAAGLNMVDALDEGNGNSMTPKRSRKKTNQNTER